jgi:hypothetical protein
VVCIEAFIGVGHLLSLSLSNGFFGRRAEAAAAAMGIQGLLPALKSIMTPGHIRDYAGKRAAVDTYCWLHKAAYTCCKDICEGRPNDK